MSVRRFDKNRVWQIRAFDGVSEAFAKQIMRALNETGTPTVPVSGPFPVEDVFASAMLR